MLFFMTHFLKQTEKHEKATQRAAFCLVDPPGLEPGAKGLSAALGNKTY
jgi:hypothetical protein